MNFMGTKKKKKKSIFSTIVLIVAIIVFCFAGFKLGTYYMTSYENKQDIKELTIKNESKPDKYLRLKKKNKDFVGWIEIKGTNVDYPVMWTPKVPEKYLRMNFKGEYALCGLPFIDAECDIYEPELNFLIYGHHMKDGTMFNNIVKYADKEYYDKHKIVHFDLMNKKGTDYEKGKYKIFAAFYAEILPKDSKEFKYYQEVNVDDKKSYKHYVDNVIKKSEYDTGYRPEYGQQLITLSTCSYHVGDGLGRFAVVAAKIN